MALHCTAGPLKKKHNSSQSTAVIQLYCELFCIAMLFLLLCFALHTTSLEAVEEAECTETLLQNHSFKCTLWTWNEAFAQINILPPSVAWKGRFCSNVSPDEHCHCLSLKCIYCKILFHKNHIVKSVEERPCWVKINMKSWLYLAIWRHIHQGEETFKGAHRYIFLKRGVMKYSQSRFPKQRTE